MEDKKKSPVLFSLTLFPDKDTENAVIADPPTHTPGETELEIKFGPTSELELEVLPASEIARKRDKTLRTVGRLTSDPALRENVEEYVVPVVALGAHTAATALRKATKKPATPKKGTAEALYAAAVGKFAAWRKKRKAGLKKQGYDEETGLIRLKPCEKLPKNKKLSRLPKLSRLSKLPKNARLPAAPKAQKLKTYKIKGRL